MLSSCSKPIMKGVAINQGGYSVYNNTVFYIDNSTIKYIDLVTGKTGVLCGKPNCKHELYDEKNNPDPICNAVAKKDCSIQSCLLVNEKLYYSVSRANVLLIYEYDYKNDKLKSISEVENLNPNNDIVYLDGCLYFNCSAWVFEEKNVDDGLGWSIGESQVFKYNLNNKSTEILFKGENFYINNLYCANNNIFACGFDFDTINTAPKYRTYIYDGNTTKKVSDNAYYYFDDNNGYINPLIPNAVSDEQVSNKIMKYNFKNQSENELCQGFVLFSYSHYMIYVNDNKYYRYDSNTDKIESIPLNNDNSVNYIDDKYVIYSLFDNSGNQTGTYVLETDEFINGNLKEAKLIEYP